MGDFAPTTDYLIDEQTLSVLARALGPKATVAGSSGRFAVRWSTR